MSEQARRLRRAADMLRGHYNEVADDLEARASELALETAVKITYFKRTGKYYTEEEWVLRGHTSDMDALGEVKIMFSVGEFPGLIGAWEGFAVIAVKPDGVPRLIDCGAL